MVYISKLTKITTKVTKIFNSEMETSDSVR